MARFLRSYGRTRVIVPKVVGNLLTLSLSDSVTTSDSLVKTIGLVKSDSATASDAITKAFTKILTDTATSSDDIAKSVGRVQADYLHAVEGDSNLIINGSFESYTGNDFSNWVETIGGSSTLTPETAVSNVESGSASLKMFVDASNTLVAVNQSANFTCKPSTKYEFIFWAKSDTSGQLEYIIADKAVGSSPSYLQGDGSWNVGIARFQANTTTTWQAFRKEFTTASGQTTLGIREIKRSGLSSQASRTFWIDNVTLQESGPIKAVGKGLSDSVTASDTATKSMGMGLSDSTTPTDSIAKAVGKTLSDSVTVTDSITVTKAQIGISGLRAVLKSDQQIVALRMKTPGVATLSRSDLNNQGPQSMINLRSKS